ncbi:MAG: peptide chain release factor-like protein [Oligosphaeraceae bacterium]|nr:peptide chain release factor-like protein [Oligosphaeraceae bacterium]
MTREELLLLDLPALGRLCRTDTYRGTGPGGQKRNKTESAVRVTHPESGLSAFDDETRSQHTNKEHALEKLRLQLAVQLRQAPQVWTGVCPALSNHRYALWLGVVFDALQAADFKIAAAAEFLGLSTNQLVKQLARDPFACQQVNQERLARQLPPLRW